MPEDAIRGVRDAAIRREISGDAWPPAHRLALGTEAAEAYERASISWNNERSTSLNASPSAHGPSERSMIRPR
jgi:hypothetical protein